MFSKSTIKYIQSLQHKKFRDQYNTFIAEGPKLVKELLSGKSFPCIKIYALEVWSHQLLPAEKKLLGDKLIIIKEFELEKISSLSHPNNVLAVFEKKPVNNKPDIRKKITLVLDDIQDPGNLGTIIRIADWFNIKNIICSLHTADMYNSKVVQSSMAGVERVNIIYTDIEEWLSKNKSTRVFAATLNGISIDKIGKLREGIIIIGNESKGINSSILEKADQKITIPKTGCADSLNAAIATGIILYALSYNSPQ